MTLLPLCAFQQLRLQFLDLVAFEKKNHREQRQQSCASKNRRHHLFSEPFGLVFPCIAGWSDAILIIDALVKRLVS